MDHQPLNSPVGVKKNELWAQYKEAVAELASKDNGTVSTTEVAKQARIEEAVNIADSLEPKSVLVYAEKFAKDIEDRREEYEQLKVAIDTKKAELKAVHDLEYHANAAVALIAARDKVIAEKEEKAKAIVGEAQEAAEDIRKEAAEFADAIRKEAKDKFEADEKDRTRRAEEWNYSFERQKQAKVDQAQDAINMKVKALQERENAVAEREEKAKDLEDEMTRIKAEMEELNNSIQDKIKAAEGKAKGMADREAKHAIALLEAEHRGAVSKLESDKASLSIQVDAANRRIESLEKQVALANDRVTSIASGALKAGADAATITEVAKTVAAGSSKGK